MRTEPWKKRGRVPLDKNTFLTLNDIKIICEACIGQGSTCLVYRGRVSSGNKIIEDTEVIIKEFYPKSDAEVLDIVRDAQTGMLKISDMTKATSGFESKFRQFQTGIDNQKRLSRSDAMEIAVKPWLEGWWGDSYYVVCDSHRGSDLSRASIDTLKKKLLTAIGIAETMDILHGAGFIMLDIKPENLLWIENPSMIRILDVDSIVSQEDLEEMDKSLLFNPRYASPEMHLLRKKTEERLGKEKLRRVRKDMLQVDSNIYSMGVYLYELFWGEFPTFSTIEDADRDELFQRFMELYAHRKECADHKLSHVGKKLVEIIGKTVIENRTKRRMQGYKDAESLMKDLNEVYTMFSSEKYVSRKEIAKANGTFAAYNLLQKYPLFQYQTVGENVVKKLEVVMVGKHAMRKDFLSALISIGQMLDTELHISLVSKDAEYFWKEYTSNKNNPALSEAVIVSKNGKIVSDCVNPILVARPLAYIHLMTKETMKVLEWLCQSHIGRYFVLLEEEFERKKDCYEFLTRKLEKHETKERYFIGYLHSHEEQSLVSDYEAKRNELIVEQGKRMDVYPICSDSFSESYNEKMFEEHIYNMGLMACAYYCGGMEEASNISMDALEADFRKDMYGIASSERSALHSIYKIASLGIARNKPGRFLNFFRKLENPVVLEKLAWLEHLSWTGYMLTSGAVPVFTQESDFDEGTFANIFNEYAYEGKNDWKDKRDSEHIRHPFLVASYLKTLIEDASIQSICQKDAPETLSEDVSIQSIYQENIPEILVDGHEITNEKWKNKRVEILDPLDKLSYRLFHWYQERAKDAHKELQGWKDKYHAEAEHIEKRNLRECIQKLVGDIANVGNACIANTGKSMVNQNKEYVSLWNENLKKAKRMLFEAEVCESDTAYAFCEEMLGSAARIMKPVLDSYNDRDLKKLDRDLVFAAVDMSI